uniref:Uncharacterized protein n=1 Tax=Oryza barthii TaxID=65489 RepID=A0A0D3FB76_9ORYZ
MENEKGEAKKKRKICSKSESQLQRKFKEGTKKFGESSQLSNMQDRAAEQIIKEKELIGTKKFGECSQLSNMQDRAAEQVIKEKELIGLFIPRVTYSPQALHDELTMLNSQTTREGQQNFTRLLQTPTAYHISEWTTIEDLYELKNTHFKSQVYIYIWFKNK